MRALVGESGIAIARPIQTWAIRLVAWRPADLGFGSECVGGGGSAIGSEGRHSRHDYECGSA